MKRAKLNNSYKANLRVNCQPADSKKGLKVGLLRTNTWADGLADGKLLTTCNLLADCFSILQLNFIKLPVGQLQ